MTEVNAQDGDRLDFLGCQNPNTGPPNPGQSGSNQIQQVSTGSENGSETLIVEDAEESGKDDKQCEEASLTRRLIQVLHKIILLGQIVFSPVHIWTNIWRVKKSFSGVKMHALPFQKEHPTPQVSDITNRGIGDDAPDVTRGKRHGLRGVLKEK